MKFGPDITRIAAVIGDPARANMINALMGGQALTAGELAHEAGVTAQTASSHLMRLTEGGLVTLRKQGRHSYYCLAGPEVAELIETLGVLADRAGHGRSRPGPSDPDLRNARVCYDHLAGDMGVRMLESLVNRGLIADSEGSLSLTVEGFGFVRTFGVEPIGLAKSRRPLCKGCLDWSVRRNHMAGALGAALLGKVLEKDWARRIPDSRVVAFSGDGMAAFSAAFPLSHRA
jgi:DNA-binding transcriptional ArsR family regulator